MTSLLEALRGECLPRPGRLETASWWLRWDADAVVVCRADSMSEPQRIAGRALDALVVQLSRGEALVRPRGVTRLLGGSAQPEHVERLHLELRGGGLDERVRLWAAVEDAALLEGLDTLELEGDEAPLEGLVDLAHTALSLGAGLALSAGGTTGPESLAALEGERDRHLLASGRLRRERDAVRDERDSLRAALHESLARIAALESQLGEVERLRRQVSGLEYQLDEARASQAASQARVVELEAALAAPRAAWAPTVTAHNLGEGSGAGLEAVCPRCRAERGADLAVQATSVTLPGGGGRLVGCARCGWAGFLRDS